MPNSIIVLITLREQVSILAHCLPEVSVGQLPSPLPIGIVAISLYVDRLVGPRPGPLPPDCRLHRGTDLSIASCEQGDLIFLAAALCLKPTVAFPQTGSPCDPGQLAQSHLHAQLFWATKTWPFILRNRKEPGDRRKELGTRDKAWEIFFSCAQSVFCLGAQGSPVLQPNSCEPPGPLP